MAATTGPEQDPARVDPGLRVAIIHYWLVKMRGGERVLERLLALFPQAVVFTHVYDPSAVSEAIRAREVRTTFINGLPGAKTHYQKYLPLMPMALEELDLSGFDLVISSESGPAKGVLPRPGARHICYCHSPMRYLWDQYPIYRAEAGALTRLVMRPAFHRLRTWDVVSAARVDRFVANSNAVKSRIWRYYRREATVVHPPVPVGSFGVSDEVGSEFLWVGQLAPYKRPDLAVDAFNALGLPLLVVGDGPMAGALRRRAKPNIRFVSRLSFKDLQRAHATARALVFTAEEDFGITPVESLASGRPVVAFGRGGVLDSVSPGETGLFFDAQTPAALTEALERFDHWVPHFDPAAAVAAAARFAPEHFDAAFVREAVKTDGTGG